ncbi:MULTISPECIES: right-handed parallel beta-helix repeat-containing protein [Methylobacterium]|uniref:right-handed parallel beta-helix repeat-containing protein n=1 Tax=Methylobacterium TaxID=407 RepID=UPI0013EC8D1D|nr:right-handed parallel beta-helix repeat-containing protein [Methylobacterium sp. DB0501]NGM38129.1 right-handed parallel beta-helix repeat-containing protein [Methylobacterium sp. DB0501]
MHRLATTLLIAAALPATSARAEMRMPFADPDGIAPGVRSGSTSDGSTMSVTAAGASIARTNADRAGEVINALDYTTLTAAANRAASTGRPLRLPAGSYSYLSGPYLTIAADVIVEPGAVLSCGSNNLQFTGTVTAGPSRIFADGCTPGFYAAPRQREVSPEWWGAIGDSTGAVGSGTDSTSAILAAINSGASTIRLCGSCTYRTTATLSVTRSNWNFLGASRDSTRFIFDDPTATADWLSVGGHAGGIRIADISVARAQAATAGALIHLTDSYYVRIDSNAIGGANAWNGIAIDGASYNPNQIYIERNQISDGKNSGIYLYGGTLATRPADIIIENHNYIKGWVKGIEHKGYGDGIFVNQNIIFKNGWSLYFDYNGGTKNINSSKIRGNDLDSNTNGAFFNGFDASHFQQNWFATGGPLVCTNCNGIVGDGNNFAGGTSGLTLNGSSNINFTGNVFSGMASPVKINDAGSTNSRYISITGSTFAFGTGYFVTFTGSPSYVTLGVQSDNNVSGVATGGASHLTVLGPQSSNNQNNNPYSSILYGQSNSISKPNSGAGGFGNNVNCYGCFATGQYNNAIGTISRLGGYQAGDDGLNGADCWASGSPGPDSLGGSGLAMTCQHVLRQVSTSTSPVRLTSNQAAAGSANCVNLPNNAHMQLELRVSGRDTSSAGNWADWAATGVNALDRGASAAATTYSGAFSTATAAQASAGAGSAASLQVTADTSNGCLDVSVTAPNTNAWRWVAYVRRVKVQ